MADRDVKELNLIIKADVQGSIEALQDSLDKMDQSEVRISTITLLLVALPRQTLFSLTHPTQLSLALASVQMQRLSLLQSA